jgi:hypothetical protein
VAWSYQLLHHDLWDYDIPAQPSPATITLDGKERDVVIQGTKQGLVFVKLHAAMTGIVVLALALLWWLWRHRRHRRPGLSSRAEPAPPAQPVASALHHAAVVHGSGPTPPPLVEQSQSQNRPGAADHSAVFSIGIGARGAGRRLQRECMGHRARGIDLIYSTESHVRSVNQVARLE